MPKDTAKTATGVPVASVPATDIVGLLAADSVLIVFAGRTYDLANLTTDEEAYLRGFPGQVPYFKTPLDVSQTASD